MKHATAGTPYRVPPEPRRWSAIMLAVAMHAMLLAFLVIGISWQNDKPAAVEAEVWDMKVQSAAPPPPPPQAEPEPEPQPAPPPAPKVVEPPAPPAPAPDIKLQQEKKHKEELRKLAEEKKAREEQKAKELAEQKEAEKKAQEEQKAKELAEKKAKADKLKAEKLKAEQLAKLKDQARRDELARFQAQAGAGTSGTAAKSTAPRMDSGYEAAIRAKIKSNTTYPGSTDEPGNPKASFRVEQLPTGEILSVTKIKSSGVPSFDDAVERGIHKSTPLPKKKDGTVERTLVVDFSMKDMN